jgi:excinuclease UvrABC helicase subunit UvrB
MQKAMDETTRRRKKQQAHNEANNITNQATPLLKSDTGCGSIKLLPC